MRRRSSGFTLLELLVATVIMGLAVAGLLANLSSSLRNAARLAGHDRAATLARAKMDELLLDRSIPAGAEVQGLFGKELAGAAESGWKARVTVFEAPPNAYPGASVLERVELEVWWGRGDARRTYRVEGYRRGKIPLPAVGP